MEKVQKIKIPREHLPAKIIRLKVQEGQQVEKGQEICYYEHDIKNERGVNSNEKDIRIGGQVQRDEVLEEALLEVQGTRSSMKTRVREILYSKYSGKVERLTVREDQELGAGGEAGDLEIAQVKEECSHAVVFNKLCSICGKDLSFEILQQEQQEREREQREREAQRHLQLKRKRHLEQEKAAGEEDMAKISMTHQITGLLVTREEAERLERETSQRLLNERKLSLIVDLDQTIIHAFATEEDSNHAFEKWIIENHDLGESSNSKTKSPQKGEKEQEQGQEQEQEQEQQNSQMPGTTSTKEVYSLFPELGYFVLPENPRMRYYIKQRPKLGIFLERLKEKYEMHIYTMGTRSYAERVAKLVDPNHEYFQERILSRDESGSITHKSIKRLFPCDDSMVVVIDDRGDIWQWSDNLVKVRPYSFFGGVGDINAVRTNNNSENAVRVDDDKTEKKNNDVQLEQVEKLTKEKLIVDRDAELENLLNVLERIHSSFYRDEDKVGSLPVSLIMNSFKSQALKGARIVFSGIFSSGIDGRQTELWKMTEQFGAICVSSGVVDETTTHVVVSNTIISQTSITEKVRRAKQISLDIQLEQKEQKDDQNTKPKKSIVAVVNLNWLHQVFSKWEWVDERPFLLFNYNTDSNLNNNNSNATVVVPFDIKDQLASSISSITSSQLEIEGQNTAGYAIQTEIDTGVAGSDNQPNAKEAVQIESLVDHVDWAEVDRELNELSDFDQSDGSDSEHTSGENENETENEDEDEDKIDEENEENEENEEKEVEDVKEAKPLYSADYVDDLLPNGKRPKLLSDPLTDLKTNVLTNDSDSKDKNGDEDIDSVDEFDDEEFADLIRDIDHETSLD